MGLGFSRRGQEQPTARRWRMLIESPEQQPTRRIDDSNDAPDLGAPKINDQEVLLQARKLCAQHGAVWEPSELDGAERWERNKTVVDDAGRRKFLALAREELLKVNGDA